MGERGRRSGFSTVQMGALAALNAALAAAALLQRARAQAARSQLDQALGALSEAVTITDAARRFRYANQAAAEVLGYPSPAALLASSPGMVRDEWIATHADGTPLRAEDVPSWKVVNGLP